MKLLDYIRKGDYSELNDVLLGRKSGRRIFSALEELTAMVRRYESEEPAVEKFINELDCCEVVDDSYRDAVGFSGNPRTKEGQAWVQSIKNRYAEQMDERSLEMLESAIRIERDHFPLFGNPKVDVKNYNRAIALELAPFVMLFKKVGCLLFFRVSSQYAYTEEDKAQIESMLQSEGLASEVIVHNIIDDSVGEDMEIEAYYCVVGHEAEYCSDNRLVAMKINEFFAQEYESPLVVDERDFARIFDKNENCAIGELITQLGAGDMEEMIRSREFRCSFPTNPTMVTLCFEFRDEESATYDAVMKLLNTLNEVFGSPCVCWGLRINPTLPENGCAMLVMTDIPDDYFGPALYCSSL